MHSIGLVVYPAFQALGLAIGTVFEYANLLGPEPAYRFVPVSEDGGAIVCSQGFSVNTLPLKRRAYDTLVVTGDNDCRLPSQSLLDYLSAAPKRLRRVTSVCTGSFVLAAGGLLEGRRATTHWSRVRVVRSDSVIKPRPASSPG